MASATIANPKELAERLSGEAVTDLTENGAPAGEKIFICYNPPVVNPELGIRAPYLGEAAKLTARFLKQKVPTIVFCQSRLATEVVLASVKKAVEDRIGDSGMVRGYRGGYLPLRRREVEQGLRSGEVLGVVTTSALELGIDIGHLDMAVLAGYPGTIASMWQQAGRAGRRTGQSAAIMVATSSPMDQYLVAHPDYLFGASPEQALINPENPFILVNHLKCGAFELPFVTGEAFGGDVALISGAGGGGAAPPGGRSLPLVRDLFRRPQLAADRDVRQLPGDRRRRWMPSRRSAARSCRGRLEGVRDDPSEPSTWWRRALRGAGAPLPGRQGRSPREAGRRGLLTDAVSAKGVWILFQRPPPGDDGLLAEQGEVLVAEKVVGFKKIKMGTLENVGAGEVELPQQEMQTTSVWLTFAPELLNQVSSSRDELLDGLRALSRLLHHLAPLFLLCDIRDVGAWLGDGSPSEAGVVVTRESAWARLREAREFTPTIYLYDNQPGGIGLAERIFQVLPDLLARGLETIQDCTCRSGCPSCVGPVNEWGDGPSRWRSGCSLA
jgi:DEAD/DEAH box helicase domain-containing protein